MGGSFNAGFLEAAVLSLPARGLAALGKSTKPELSSRFKAIRALRVCKRPEGPLQSSHWQSCRDKARRDSPRPCWLRRAIISGLNSRPQIITSPQSTNEPTVSSKKVMEHDQPAGRGRNVRRAVKFQARLIVRNRFDCCSLSHRERARVRGEGI